MMERRKFLEREVSLLRWVIRNLRWLLLNEEIKYYKECLAEYELELLLLKDAEVYSNTCTPTVPNNSIPAEL